MILSIPIPKLSTTIAVDTDKIPDEIMKQVMIEGLIVALNRRLTLPAKNPKALRDRVILNRAILYNQGELSDLYKTLPIHRCLTKSPDEILENFACNSAQNHL